MFKHFKKSKHQNQVQPLLQPSTPPSSAAAKPLIPPTIKLKEDGLEVNPISTVQMGKKQALVLSIDDDDSSELSSSKYRFELVAKFFHGDIPEYDTVKQFLKKSGLEGGMKLYKLNPNHILIKLTHDSDFRRLWLRPIWRVNNDFQMHISKWSPDFDYETSVVRVRIGVPNLRNNFMDPKNALPSIANLVGKCVEVDTLLERYREYSICVKIDLKEPRVNKVRLMNFNRLIELRIHYQDLPKFCKDCRQCGHSDQECNLQSDYLTIFAIDKKRFTRNRI